MCLIHFVIDISQKCMSSADIWKYRDSVLGNEDCLAANSKSMGPPQKSADNQNCSINSAVRPTILLQNNHYGATTTKQLQSTNYLFLVWRSKKKLNLQYNMDWIISALTSW